MEDDREDNSQPKGKRRRQIWISIGIILALLIIFHRLILLGAIHWFAVHRAAQENLKLSFHAEGNVFTALTVRNLHLVPTGPAAIEIADAEYVHAEYSLFSLIRGHADFLESIEARNARVVVDPAKVQGASCAARARKGDTTGCVSGTRAPGQCDGDRARSSA